MAEQKKQLTVNQSIAKAPIAWSLELIKNFSEKNPGLMQSDVAQRCAMSAVSKVIDFMTEQRMSWDVIDTSRLSRILLRLAVLGLDADAGDWYAYSRLNSKTNLQQFEPAPSYNGERKLRIKYSIGSFGKIKDIQAITIRKGDKLVIKRDLMGRCKDVDYEPIPFNKEEIIGYLGVTYFEDGTTTIKEFTPEKIETYHKANPNKSPAWDKWYEEMAHAKVIKHTSREYQYEVPSTMKRMIAEMDIEDIDENIDALENSIDITPDGEVLDRLPAQVPEQVAEKQETAEKAGEQVPLPWSE